MVSFDPNTGPNKGINHEFFLFNAVRLLRLLRCWKTGKTILVPGKIKIGSRTISAVQVLSNPIKRTRESRLPISGSSISSA